MNLLPLPYPGELLYSVIARAGVHWGILSPKELLLEVFQNKKIIATPDLPSHIAAIAGLYPLSLRIDQESLIYKHTLFPLYAPFVPEERRQACLKWLLGDSRGALHLALGLSASKVNVVSKFRYCPGCLKEQLANYGEYCWQRQWQVHGTDCCVKHGSLLESPIYFHDPHRHQFFAAAPDLCKIVEQVTPSPASLNVARQIRILLNIPAQTSPTFGQWTNYYHGLALRIGCNKGQYTDYLPLLGLVCQHWSASWLAEMGLAVDEQQSCWLRSIFRKHRKSFSYLQHIIVLDALLDTGWRIDSVIAHVKDSKPCTTSKKSTKKSAVSTMSRRQYRLKWLEAVSKLGAKVARHNGYGDCYAWLYRHDTRWLLKANRRCKLAKYIDWQRIDWQGRDREVVKALVQIQKHSELDLWLPRMSRNWWLKQLGNSSSIEKNLHRLPLVVSFFARYAESTEDFQIRRLTRELIDQTDAAIGLKRCMLLRDASLSEERLRPLTRRFLGKVIGI